VLTLVGAINVPIIYFSVRWWNTLHQGASVGLTGPTMARTMFAGMLLMIFAAWAWCIAAALWRVGAIILERERGAAWIGALPAAKGAS
jgi:heme exporter protein C